MRVSAILTALFYAGIAIADQNSAFRDGRNLGSSVNQGVFSGINSGSAADKVPAYGTNPSETQYYQGGQGQLSGPGVAKMQACATSTPNSDPIKRQECEAVNFLARNPQIRPQFDIGKNDPMILAAKHARNNAESFFRSLGINGGTGSSTQCTTKTETLPAQYTTETCSSIREIGEQQCTMGRSVNIDTDANFQCEQTTASTQQLSCRKKKIVSVSQNCNHIWVTREWPSPRGPFGHVISTYDDFRHGPQSVCDYLWSGSVAVSASCYPACARDEEGLFFICRPSNPTSHCDHKHNHRWFTSYHCLDRGWCNGSGISYISCRKQELSCTPVVTINEDNQCATLERRAI